MNPGKHLSTQFDSELNSVSAQVMELGGLVESQIGEAMGALLQLSANDAHRVIAAEALVNHMEIEIDRELSSIIARRQPTARDLRLLIAISKITANLERAGDEAEKIARLAKSTVESGASPSFPASELRVAARLASGLLRKSLDAFARLDPAAAIFILKEDQLLDREFVVVVDKLAAWMTSDPASIPAAIDLLFVAKAVERIGDHAKNIAEVIIYVVNGTDVRHTSIEQIESAAR